MAGVHCACSFNDASFLTGTCTATLATFLALVQVKIMSDCNMTDPCRRLGHQKATPLLSEYDFIVVGAGVAGPVVASRLSENHKWKVLLLEAGPNEPTLTSVPAFSMRAVMTDLDWQYYTEPSPNACLSRGGRCYWPRGRMVSGSSGMQGMMYTRPHHSIFDDWNKTNPGWSYEDVLPYFIKSERNLNPKFVEKGYHGFKGPMTVQQFPSRPSLADVVVKAGQQMGFRYGDLCGKNQTGVTIAQMMVYEALRMSTARAYIRPFLKKRHNLKTLINSQVTKILINKVGHRTKAIGVQYVDKQGRQHTVHARKEVILAAGAVNSPQLLLLSGVGPREDLERTVVDLPGVGRNLQNHVAVGVGFHMDDNYTETLTNQSLEDFLQHRNGSLASTGLVQATFFMTSKYAENGVPDLQVFLDGFVPHCSETGSPEECVGTGKLGNCGKRSIYARPTNILPLSRGYLKLKSSNPVAHPLIYPNYLAEQRDIDILVDGIKLCIQLTQTPALQKYNLTLDETPVKGCEGHKFGSDEYWECVIRTNTGAENHQAGSCKMGPACDPLAVVDHKLRVHGVENIRVVDASFFPVNPNSNPTSVIIMAAEKASDMIKNTWKRSRHTC